MTTTNAKACDDVKLGGRVKAMTIRFRHQILMLVLCLLTAPVLRGQNALAVTSAQPNGEIGSLAEANEIRIRFSEPMVPLGRIPDQVTAPYFSIRPAVRGSFRWAGPTILVFTPDPRTPLPFATRYDVTISAAATAYSGRHLERPIHSASRRRPLTCCRHSGTASTAVTTARS